MMERIITELLKFFLNKNVLVGDYLLRFHIKEQ
jgi:hypothetical protein